MRALLALVIALSACTDTVSGSYRGSFTLSPNGAGSFSEGDVLANVGPSDARDIQIWFDGGSCLVQGAEAHGDRLTFPQATGSCDIRALSEIDFDIDGASGSVVNDQLVLNIAGGYPSGFAATYMGGLEPGTR